MKKAICLYLPLLAILAVGGNIWLKKEIPIAQGRLEAKKGHLEAVAGMETALWGRIRENGGKAGREAAGGTVREVSAYNVGDKIQCSGDPCVSASGEDVCRAVRAGLKRCAANFVPLGTVLRIEGWGECLVADRMNKRYAEAVDIAMGPDEVARAVEFGRRNLLVEIMK